MYGKRNPTAGRREVVVIDRAVEVAVFREALLGLRGDVERNRFDLFAGQVELPNAEVVLKDDRLAVGGDRRPAHVAILEPRDLLRLTTGFGDPPDVRKSLPLAIA